MATVDDKVVAMSFETGKFEQGINKTITSLDKLKEKLTFAGAGKGLDDVSRAAGRVDLSHIASGVDDIKGRLGGLRLAGIAVFANLATQAVSAGARVIKAFTLDPVTAGFHNYETQINAVQTILANTGLKGKKGLGQVNDALSQLNTYANKTVYNFSEMAKNIGTFTAAGVDLKTSTASIKGIANLAALSGSSSEQASTAMYQLSQAIAAGQVHLQDWNSVVNAGMGGKVFQKALADTAQAMGVLKDGSVKLVGPMKQLTINGQSFRQALQVKPGQKSWLTSQVLTNTLKQFTGDMSKAQLRAQGFNDAQIKAIQAQGSMASHAATNIKTFTQLQQALKEEVATAWGAIFKTIFGDLGHATTLFSKIHTVAENALTIPIYNLNKLLEGWAKLGGRANLIKGLSNVFKALGAVMAPIKAAFRDIFPPTTAKSLADATKRFEQFTEKLKPSHETVENLRRTFRGLFAVLDIGKQIVVGIFSVLGHLFGAVGKGSGGFLHLTGNIGDFLVKVDDALKKGDRLHNFFALLGQIIVAPIHALGVLKDAITNSTQGLHPVQRIVEGIQQAWAKLTGQVSNSGNVFKPAVKGITNVFASLGQAITDALTHMNFNTALNAIEVGLIGGIALMFKKFATGGFDNAILGGLFKNISGSFGGLAFALKGVGGAFGGVSKVLGGLTGNLQAMQQKTKAQALKEIAIAIALIAASAVALSLVNPAKLNSALSALTIMFGQLLGSMAILDKIAKSGGFLKIPVIAASMIALAVAVDLLALAVFGLSKLSWAQLAKGLVGVGTILASVSIAAKPLGANSAGLIRAGVGISAIGVALNILALAVRQFGSMDIATLGKGLGAVAVALAGIGLASKAFPTGMIQIGVGLTVVAGALLLLSMSVEKFGNMKWGVIGRGILGVAGSLLVIAVAMRAMPTGMVAQAAAMAIVALALQGIAKAVTTFGGMSITQIAKGLGTLAGALLILAVGMMAMEEALPGAAALVVAAAGIALLAPALTSLGKQSWGQIIKSMVALAAALAILGLASIALLPASPALLALGAALLLIGAGLALAGAGIALVGIGLAAIAVSGPVAVGILVKAFEAFGKAVPAIATSFVNGLLSIVQKIAQVAPQFVAAIIKIVEAMVNAIPVLAPKLAQGFLALLNMAIKVLEQAFPKIVEAGFQMLMSLLRGISMHIQEVTKMVVNIVTKFLGAIANKIPQIIGAGANILIKLLQGVANNIGKIATAATDIVVSFVRGIGNNLARIVTAGTQAMAKFLEALASGYSRVLRAGTDVVVHFITGIGNSGSRIVTAGANAMAKFINAMISASLKLVNVGAQAVIKFLNGVAGAIRRYEPQLLAAGVNIGTAIVQGMINGIGQLAPALMHRATKLITDLPHKALKLLGIGSPSKVFHEIGTYIVMGLTNGISSSDSAVAAAAELSNNVIGAFKSIFQIESPSKVMIAIGKQVNQGFVQGLTGTTDDIKKAFNDLNQKITDAMASTRQAISSDQAKLDRLNSAKKKDKSAIAQVTDDMNKQNKALHALRAAHSELVSGLDKDKAHLIDLAKQYAKVTGQLDDATKALADAQKAQSDFAASTSDTFGALPDVVTTDQNGNPVAPSDQLKLYEDRLTTQANAVNAFKATLDQLRALGLDDKTYQKLLNDGVGDQQFADQLLQGGKDAVNNLNQLDSNLSNAAGALGDDASHSLYDAGVAAAQGLVDGLKSKQDEIAKTMEGIATEMVHAIKSKLHIKSPSGIFAEIGQFVNSGMAQGLTGSVNMVTDAVSSVADSAVSAMQRGLGNISDIVASHIDTNPTITPVLDLTHIQTGADAMSSIFANVVPIGAASAGQASAISGSQAGQVANTDTAAGGKVIKFEQNNYSPESLSAIEIYRLTKNQLSQAKAALVPA